MIWVDRQGAVEALYVKPASPGLTPAFTVATACSTSTARPIERATDVTRVLARIGAMEQSQIPAWNSRGVQVTATRYLWPSNRSTAP